MLWCIMTACLLAADQLRLGAAGKRAAGETGRTDERELQPTDPEYVHGLTFHTYTLGCLTGELGLHNQA